MTAQTFFALSRRRSAILAGIFESMKKSTRTIVPAIIISAFQLIARNAWPGVSIPVMRNSAAAPSAKNTFLFGMAMISPYITANMTSANQNWRPIGISPFFLW